jgi:AcrR family transcriptional regulator
VTTTRRERTRAATFDEIVATARRLLIADGPTAVTLRAIARDMGMTAPGLYRYVASHEDLMNVLIAALFEEVTGELEAARDGASPEVGARLLATSRAFRRWALANPTELALVFGSPLPGFEGQEGSPVEEAGTRFGGVFLGLFAELWAVAPFPVRDEAEMDPRLVAELQGWLPPGVPLPLGAVEVFLRCWMRLYGAVTMEGFGQLKFAISDAEALFELELAALGDLLGATYEPPAGPGD